MRGIYHKLRRRLGPWQLSILELVCWHIVIAVGAVLCVKMGELWVFIAVPLCLVAVMLVITRFHAVFGLLIGGALASVVAGAFIHWDNQMMRIDDWQSVLRTSIYYGLLGAVLGGCVDCTVRGRRLVGLIIGGVTVLYFVSIHLFLGPS